MFVQGVGVLVTGILEWGGGRLAVVVALVRLAAAAFLAHAGIDSFAPMVHLLSAPDCRRHTLAHATSHCRSIIVLLP